MGVSRTPRKSEEILTKEVWAMIPGLLNCVWYAQGLTDEAIEQIGWIRKGLDNLEKKLKEEREQNKNH